MISVSADRKIDEGINHLIEKYAEENGVPEELLREIYRIEQDKITMERRDGLPSDLRTTMEDFIDHDD